MHRCKPCLCVYIFCRWKFVSFWGEIYDLLWRFCMWINGGIINNFRFWSILCFCVPVFHINHIWRPVCPRVYILSGCRTSWKDGHGLLVVAFSVICRVLWFFSSSHYTRCFCLCVARLLNLRLPVSRTQRRGRCHCCKQFTYE
jgi:hypothetical protein